MNRQNDYKIAVIGMGYVGLPLAIEFGKKFPTYGFDINEDRINELFSFEDNTLEVTKEALKAVVVKDIDLLKLNGKGVFLTSNLDDLHSANIYIITVPTPTDKNNRLVLTHLIKASEAIGSILKNKDIVIYESTVYPGVTEDKCVPILESVSELRFNKDFFVGYSPERINPGDKERIISKIIKVTSGSTPESAKEIDNLYKEIITAGTHLAPSIKIAEAAKVIENSQRDINIAFVNELAKIFNLLEIDTQAVLEAAGTKWNFLPFKPGLVGGHCIGIDPYSLAQKAQEMGYHPEIILSGRRINDSMGSYVGNEVIKQMTCNSIQIKGSKVLILGITFKENCPDIRNTKVVDVISTLEENGIHITIYDPWANINEVQNEYDLKINSQVPRDKFDAIVLAVAHKEFLDLDFNSLKSTNGIIYDVKGVLEDLSNARL